MMTALPVSTLPLQALIQRQLDAIDAWNTLRHDRQAALVAGAHSREDRVDVTRRINVLNRVHASVVAQTTACLADQSAGHLRSPVPRAVIAHHHEWFVSKLTEALGSAGVHVVGTSDNGPDALGMAVAEQPDVLIVGDPLQMMAADELLADAVLLAPHTVRAAHVPYNNSVGAMLDAGAHAVLTQQVPPEDVAARVVELLRHAPLSEVHSAT